MSRQSGRSTRRARRGVPEPRAMGSATCRADEVAPIGFVAVLPAHSVVRLDPRSALFRTQRRA
jgi:hypothetical protein